jgi:hypothetical protein
MQKKAPVTKKSCDAEKNDRDKKNAVMQKKTRDQKKKQRSSFAESMFAKTASKILVRGYSSIMYWPRRATTAVDVTSLLPSERSSGG